MIGEWAEGRRLREVMGRVKRGKENHFECKQRILKIKSSKNKIKWLK